MENILKEIGQLIKVPNDSNIQLRIIQNLNEILEFLKKCEKKKLTESQPLIEELLFSIINSNRANSDISNRYIYLIYKYLFDNGHSSRLTEFIIKYTQLINNNKININIKASALWLLGKVCSKSLFKSPQLTEFLNSLIKLIKNTNEIFIKSECFSALSRLLMLKLPNFYNQVNDIIKIILKQEKYLITDIKCKKNILKALDSLIFYLNQNLINQNHEYIISFLNKNLVEEEPIVQKHAIKIFVNLHCDKIFDTQINLTRIIRKKQAEQLKNFIEVILYVGNFIIAKNDITINLKISYINIVKILLEKNKEFLNANENLIPKIFDLLYDNFRLNYNGFNSNFNLNKHNLSNIFSGNNTNLNINSNSVTVQHQNQQNLEILNAQNKLNFEIEDLYRLFIKLIYHSSLRKNLLKHIFKKINEAQGELDKMENSSLNFGNFKNMQKRKNESTKDNHKEKDKQIKKIDKTETKIEKFNEAQVNSILFSLIEYAENNYDIFEIVFKNFNEISQALLPYLISPVKSFRMLANRIFINLAYFIPGWRITILTLILNFSSVAHAEVAALKNTFIYTIDETNAEFKYSLIIRNNLELLKDISNCLAIILTTFSHTHKGVTIDMSNAALSIAKNMIIGKFADEDDNPKSLSVLEKARKFSYSNADVDAHKEAGWIIIEGLCSMDYTWQTYNYKSLNLLWKYIFSENCCQTEEEHLSKPEYREALISEFFIKKSALSSLRKFILSSKEYKNSSNFQNTIPKHLSNAINFFIPQDQKKTILFYKTALKDKYKDAKIILYNCLALVQPKLYTAKFNHILHFLCEEIISSEYIEYSLDFIYSNLNFFDSFLCEKYNEKKIFSNLSNSNNYYTIDLYNIDNFDILFSEKIQAEINSRIVNSSINLLVEILLDNSFYAKNRHSILKYFLSQMSEISLKQIDQIKKNKALNINYCLFYILKKSHEKKIFIINDESLFASSKMIFDIGFKMENNLIRRISSEGHSYLIKASSNPQYNLNYYLTALECKFKNESNLDNNHFISTFYMIANIFRISEFNDILPILDNYMNFIISYFNKIEDLFNPYISQSILIITEVLIINNKIDHARKMIEVFKLNYLFINRDNNVYFKDLIERNSLAEIKLLLMMSLLNENIKSSEIDLFKLILNKFILDEKYKSLKIKKAFLYLAKVIISNKKIKELIHKENFLNFLCNNINESNNITEVITNQSNKIFNLNLIQRFSIEILILYLLKSEKEDPFLKTFAEKLIITLNNEYNTNNLFHYNNLIFKQIYKTPSTKNIFFDRNNMQNLIDIHNFINIQNNSNLILIGNTDKNTSLVLFSLIFPKYHLIKLYKIFLKIFFEKKTNQTLFIINMIKDLIQNQLALYSSSVSGKSSNSGKSDALTKSEETKDDLIKNLPLLLIRDLDKTLHVNLKIFLIKCLTNCLKITLFNISKISDNINTNNNYINNKSNSNNAQKYLEFLNHFMSISMVLILSEECWDIKVNGVNLLIEIIKRFARIKDDRVDDNSLLIQQYEAQISSCIKMIFGNNFSIESLFKGMDLLYCYICIPITTDYTYVKRIDNFIDIDLHKNNPGTIFSEKYDHFFITKKLKFFCRLYLTSLIKDKKITNNNKLNNFKSICVFNSDVSDLEIHGENLEGTKNIEEYFNLNLPKFFKNLFDMLCDFNIILNSEPKYSKYYKNYEFLASGNRIAYSYKKVHKYSQIYLKIMSFILHDKRTKAPNFLENILIDNQSMKIDEINFDNICEIIIYHINHFSNKNSQNLELNMVSISDFNIYSENDITFELREKIILNGIKILEMMEILYQILLSAVKITKKIITKIFNLCFFLVSFSIKEFDEHIFNIAEILIKKIIENKNKNIIISQDNDCKISNINESEVNLNYEETIALTQNLTKFCYNYYTKNLNNNAKNFFAENNSGFLSKIIDIIFYTSNLILSELNELELEELSNANSINEQPQNDLKNNFLNNNITSNNVNLNSLNDFLILCKIQFGLFNNTVSQQICKISAAKLFNLLSCFKNLKILKLFYDILFDSLNSIIKYDKFFILYYMILQNISKRYLINKNLENEKTEISEKLNKESCLDEKLRKIENEIIINEDIIDFTNMVLMKDLRSKINFEKINLTEKNTELKEKIYFLLKSMSFASNNNFDNLLKNFFENVLFYSFEEKIFSYLINYEEFQTLILQFTLSIENDEKRKNLILILLFLFNEKSVNSNNNDITRYALICLKMITKDLELIGGIAPLLDRNFITQINNLAILQRNQMSSQQQQQKLKESNINNNQNVSVENNSLKEKIENKEQAKNVIIEEKEDNNIKKSSGPKLKALKFGK